jgi:hypothetical protein
MTFDDVREAFLLEFGKKYSRSSVGPTLISNEAFVRLAPGVYGVREHVRDPTSIAAGRRLLLTPRQLEIYCLARWAAEPLCLYPLWTIEMEREWATWATETDRTELLSSLLFVAQIDRWDVGPIERENWMRRRALIGQFLAQSSNPIPITETVPSLRELLSILVMARLHGGVSWISANRVRGARIDDRHSHSTLGLAIALGLVAAPEHWQKRHKYLGDPHGVIEMLAKEAARCPRRMWSSRAVSVLLDIARTETAGWISSRDLMDLLDAIYTTKDAGEKPESTPEDTSQSDLESLLRITRTKAALEKSGLIS